MQKHEFLGYWSSIKANQSVTPSPVQYKHEGSTFDQDGIRITGSEPFIASVLSRLTDLLECENDETRLQVVYKQSVDKDTGRPLDAFNCYIQVHERGNEAKIMNMIVRGARERQAIAAGK